MIEEEGKCRAEAEARGLPEEKSEKGKTEKEEEREEKIEEISGVGEIQWGTGDSSVCLLKQLTQHSTNYIIQDINMQTYDSI